MTIDANTLISIYAEGADTPDWTGSLGSFIADNEFDEAEERNLRRDLETVGKHQTGGGAAEVFFVKVCSLQPVPFLAAAEQEG